MKFWQRIRQIFSSQHTANHTVKLYFIEKEQNKNLRFPFPKLANNLIDTLYRVLNYY